MREAVESRLHAVSEFSGFSLAIVGVVVGIEVLVVFLTMMGSVSERTTEIGVFRAIGFRRAQITRLVLLEAVVAGLIAGVLGYARRHGRDLRRAAAARRGRPGGVDAAARRGRGGGWRRSPAPSPPSIRRCAPASSIQPRRCARCERGHPFQETGYDCCDHADARDRRDHPDRPSRGPAGGRAGRALHRRARSGEDLRRRRRAGARPARARPRRRRGHVPRRDGAVRAPARAPFWRCSAASATRPPAPSPSTASTCTRCPASGSRTSAASTWASSSSRSTWCPT